MWNIEYRRVGDDGGDWPNTYLDVGHGADYLRRVAAQYQLDLNRVIASGHSAGGAFALWLAARGKIQPSSELYVKDPLRVRVVGTDRTILLRAHASGWRLGGTRRGAA